MKTKLTILFLLCLCTLSAAGQGITRQKCATCGKLKVQCPYKGNHPKPQPEKTCASCGKVISKCPYKGNHPKPQETKSKLQTIASEKPKQQPKANQPKTVNVSYDASSNSIVFGGNQYKMVYVSGGTFMMGAISEKQIGYYEKPHTVTVNDYYIGQTEVTQALWTAVMGDNPSNWKGDNLPVETVSWYDCQEFIDKLNAKTGRTFRMPTEAEWEFAARGGNDSRHDEYSGSNCADDVAWYKDNSDSKTHTVATKQANELGIYDMSGNVSEWCQDTWHSTKRLRGGGWDNFAGYCSVLYIYNFVPHYTHNNLGLRLVLQP